MEQHLIRGEVVEPNRHVTRQNQANKANMTGTPATPALRRFSHLRIGTLSGGQLDEGERRMLRSGSYSRDVI
jgi:hypothetical protein